MKKKIMTTLIIFLAIAVFFLWKINTIHKYTIEEKEQEKVEKIAQGLIIEDLKVITSEELDTRETLEYNNITIKNIFTEFECKEIENTYQCKKDDDTTFEMKKTTSFVEKLQNSNSLEWAKIVKDNKIVSDIELFGLIKEAVNHKTTIFQFNRDIKRNYYLQKYAIEFIPLMHSMDLVEGDYSGYLLHTSSNSRELYITYKKNTYTFQFTNLDYFTEEVIQDFMNSIIISK